MTTFARPIAALDLAAASPVAIIAIDWTDDGPLYLTVDGQGATGTARPSQVQVVSPDVQAAISYARTLMADAA